MIKNVNYDELALFNLAHNKEVGEEESRVSPTLRIPRA